MALRPASSLLWFTLLCWAIPALAAAQQEPMSRAFDLERRGEYAAAAAAYRSVLAARPGDAAALLGLERVLLPLNRSADIIPTVRSALAANPLSAPIHGVALRAWAAADQPDSMRAAAERWAGVAPNDEAPYREWGAAALGRQDRAGALEAYTRGRQKLGRTDALAAEMAQLATAESDYLTALREWLPAIRKLPGYRVTVVAALGQVPANSQPELLRMLGREDDFIARRLEAELRARWGDPLGGLRTLEAALPVDRTAAVDALSGLIDQLRGQRTQAALLVQGRALEAVAARTPEPRASRIRLQAAQAYSAAGDREAARRMLTGLALDRSAPGAVSSDAAATLVSVLVDEGKLEEAGRRLADLAPSLAADEYGELRRRLVQGWIRSGELSRADSLLGADSTVEGLALAGRIRLYRGDLRGAVERFQAAGPYAGDRAEATRRTALLALLQPIEPDSLPALGAALLQLERGDTADAMRGLEGVAQTLEPTAGGAELQLLAAKLAVALRKPAEAERLFRGAAADQTAAAAPAAELALAQLLLDQQRQAEAVALLEHMILTFPESALVPQARRVLDQARGAVPRT
jgi:hypothetical protein